RVHQVHGVDHHRHVRGVLARAVGELLYRADRVLVEDLLPAREVRALPVAVGAAHVDHAVARDLVEDGVDPGRGGVVGIDQQGDAAFGVHGTGGMRGTGRSVPLPALPVSPGGPPAAGRGLSGTLRRTARLLR